jgi:hypothetical protein
VAFTECHFTDVNNSTTGKMKQLQRKSNQVLTENTTGTITKGNGKLHARKKKDIDNRAMKCETV